MKNELCIACNKKLIKFFDYNKFKYFQCTNCKLVSTYPYPSSLEITKHYKTEFKKGNYKFIQDYSNDYLNIYKGFVNEIKKYYKENNTSINKMSVLDIGCFTGEFLNLMMNEGVKVHGVELQEEAVKIANKKLKGKKVIVKNINDSPFKKNKFDIITMFGLIEHVENPILLIQQVSKMLKVNGIIVIQTPNNNSIIARILKNYWPPYTPIEHIHLFNKFSINKVLISNNMIIVKFKNHIKILPISYVYLMLNVFSPEIKKILDKIPYLNLNNSNISIPFYIGEMFIIAKKNKNIL